jgi:hypothetical protein
MKKARLAKNEGFGATRRTPRQFTPRFMGFLKFGDNARDNNPFRPVHLPYDLKRALNRLDVRGSREQANASSCGPPS